jgi:hypothetical protein
MVWLVLVLLLITQNVGATILVFDPLLSANCTSGNYSAASHDCTGTIGENGYSTTTSAISALVAGDTLRLRGGTHNVQLDFQTPNKTGTASAWITVEGYPGETAILQYNNASTNSYGAVKARGNRGYFIFQDFKIDGSLMGNNSGWGIRDGNHHFILRRLEIYNQFYHGVYMDGTDVTIEEVVVHDARTDCVSGNRHHGFYLHNGARVLAQRNTVYNMPGSAVQLYPGPWTNATIKDNYGHHNTSACSNVITTAGIVVGTDNDPNGGSITDAEVSGNIIAFHNINQAGTPLGQGAGIRVYNDNTGGVRVVSGTKVYNNTIYKTGNNPSLSSNEYCMLIGNGALNTDVKNNIITECGGGGAGGTTAYFNGGTGTTTATNACKGTENCPSKVTITDVSSCLVDAVNEDFRLKQGANTCVDAGTSVTTRLSPVSTVDIGAYERGSVTSAVVASSFIEVTVSVMSPGVLPASAITAFTIANGTSTGTPVVSSAVVKAGANNVIQLTVSGFSGNGTCTVSYGAGNMTDSLYIGGSVEGAAQGVNSVAALAVTGTCMNSAGATPPASGLHIHYKLNENAGTNANDETANNLDGTLVNSPTWTTPVIEGSGLYFPSDGTDKKVTIPYGDALNPTSNSFTFCVWLKPDSGLNSKIAFGALSTTNRLYVGYSTTTWGIGIGSSSFSSGQSEFPVSNANTRVCLINDAATDTAKLAVNGVIGTSAAAVKSTTGFTDLASDFRLGCSILSQSYCGGFTMDEVKIWTGALSAAEILEDFSSYTPAGGSVVCYKQQNHRWQRVSLDPSLAAENMGAAGATVDIVENGAVALVIQIDCTGSAGSALALRAFYSTNGSTFSFPIPAALGSDSIAFWGDSTDAQLNRFTATCCLSGALTANDGVTILSSVVTPTITLSQNHSYTVRLIIRVGAIAGQSRYIRLYQDNGAVLAGGYTTTPQLNVVPMKANSGP